MRNKQAIQGLLFGLIFVLGLSIFHLAAEGQEPETGQQPVENLLKLLGISPSSESIDYVQNKTQFQLHTLLTEQRHRKTWNLSKIIRKDYEAGLKMLFAVDEDIENKLAQLLENQQKLDLAVQAVEEAVLEGNKIYIYGCGATGRLAKQMESTFWRPFWNKVEDQKRIWKKLKGHLSDHMKEQLIGEMTGADRALISSLEGFEDLILIGRLQLLDRKVKKGDVVFCVTEGGETSSVIGTILAALDQWKTKGNYSPDITRKKLFFIYNNPDELLLPFNRSRRVLEEPGITKINLTTGPQSITGSTRMQATTIETFVVGHILQAGVDRALRHILSNKDMSRLGFKNKILMEKKLSGFKDILKNIKANLPAIARLTELETATYQNNHFSTYFAGKGLITVFIDSTERSPTFRLHALDTVIEKKRRCWIQVWTSASSRENAWKAFLGRPFRGLSPGFYEKPFAEKISDPYLRKAALESLKNAGNDQQDLYDFSFADFNIKNRGPEEGDLGICVLIGPEEDALKEQDSDFRKFTELHLGKKARTAVIVVSDKSEKTIKKLTGKITGFSPETADCLIHLKISAQNDPFNVDQQIALKILLNAHSTAVMARLGKVIGNTMTNVSPSNLKLIGRATYLIQSHINDVLKKPRWVKKHGIQKPLVYGVVNAVLFDSIEFLKRKKAKAGQTAEVALSIIRILESLRLRQNISQERAFKIVNTTGLAKYLADLTS